MGRWVDQILISKMGEKIWPNLFYFIFKSPLDPEIYQKFDIDLNILMGTKPANVFFLEGQCIENCLGWEETWSYWVCI